MLKVRKVSDKNKLKDDINDVWKTIFEYLGKDERMDEDWFLKYHVVMYWGRAFNQKEDMHKTFLLNNFFTIQKIFNEKKENYKEAYIHCCNLKKYKTKLQNLNLNKLKYEEVKKILFDIYNSSYEIQVKLKDDFLSQFVNIDKKRDDDSEYYLNMYMDTKGYSILEKGDNLNEFIELLECDIERSDEEINNNYLHYDLIESYISSLKDSIKSYYFILNPEKSNYDSDIKSWLEKINIIGFSEFMPILISIFNHYNKKDKKFIIKIIQDIENYLFVKKYCFVRGQQWFGKDFYKLAYEYNNKQNIETFYSELNILIYENDIIENFKKDNFILNINELFKEKKEKDGNGYYKWSGLKYVLYEYEISLQKHYHGESKVLWKHINNDSIEHICPQTLKGTWIDDFNNLKGNKQRNKYINSLGNLLLLSSKKNSKASNKDFDEKKEIYSSGSFNEIEVSKYEKWTTKEIDERSEKILEFMNKRWHLGLKVADISKLK